ncbi:hypothetical protein, partial [Paracoccus shanxieyensis]|uniref:hypothetical protein n=1 Tax=Paracoccus shanxieyensis TaxID=2675752 RepID=UPI001E39F9CB
AQFRHRNAALSLAQHRHDLRLGKSGFSYSNLLSSRYEKILLPNPLTTGRITVRSRQASQSLVPLRYMKG